VHLCSLPLTLNTCAGWQMDCTHCGYYKTADADRSWESAMFTPLWLAHFTVCSEGLINICAICCLLSFFSPLYILSINSEH